MYKYEFLIIIFNMRSCLQQPYPFQHTPLPVSPPLTPTPQNLPLILFLNYANHTDHNVIIFDGPTPLAPPPSRCNPQFTTLSRLSRSVPPDLSETVPQLDHWIKFPPNVRGKRILSKMTPNASCGH